MIWYEGMNGWTRAGEVPELKDIFIMLPPLIQKERKETSLVSNQGVVKSGMDIFIFLSISYWVFSELVMFILRILVHNWFQTPVRYIQTGFNLIFAVIPIVFALSIKDKTLRIIALILGIMLSLYILISNIYYLFA
jgi:flagellar biosynthesis protein FlhB